MVLVSSPVDIDFSTIEDNLRQKLDENLHKNLLLGLYTVVIVSGLSVVEFVLQARKVFV